MVPEPIRRPLKSEPTVTLQFFLSYIHMAYIWKSWRLSISKQLRSQALLVISLHMTLLVRSHSVIERDPDPEQAGMISREEKIIALTPPAECECRLN